MTRRFVAPGFGLVFLSLFVAGCGNSASVSGLVTFENKPVKNGWITFTPADGKGQDAGAVIKDGRYSVSSMTPGSKVVNVSANPSLQHAKTTEELAEQAKKGIAPAAANPEDLIPPDAEGNNITIDIASGNQARDFHLTKKK